jgi:hypothetical protein
VVHIPELGWTITARSRGPGVTRSEAEYNPSALAFEHRLMPLWYSSQFTTDVPHVPMFVIPYGFRGNPFGINVFNSTVMVFDSIAEYVFWSRKVGRNHRTAI